MPSSSLIVLTTLPKLSKARQIAAQVLQKNLAACVNLLGPVESSFRWQGKIDHAKEYLLLMKTRASHFARLRHFLERNHPYSVPEIVALAIEKGNTPYLEWLKASVGSD